MSLYQSPSVLSVEIQAARRYLREFNILVVSQIRHGDLLELRAQHEKYGGVSVSVVAEDATAEYMLSAVMQSYATRIYVRRESRHECQRAAERA